MANDAHLKILKEGVRAWNTWKRDNPAIRPNLAESNLIETFHGGGSIAFAIAAQL
jgi:hypothetical protein